MAAMRDFAQVNDFPFPYVLDEDAGDRAGLMARSARRTFFGFDRDMGLQYRGRLDASKTPPPPPPPPPSLAPDARRELLEAMRQVARTGQGPQEQVPRHWAARSKWREAAVGRGSSPEKRRLESGRSGGPATAAGLDRTPGAW